MAGPSTHRPPRDLDDLYTSPPPWDIGRPQPAFAALAEAGAIDGRVLDVGCGTGEHTLMAAALGLDATGIDLATGALEAAREKARRRSLTARFLRHDLRRLPELGETFDTVLDSLVFHALTDADRAAYLAGLRTVLRPAGRAFLLCYGDRRPGEREVPHGLGRDRIRASFTSGWRVDSLQPAVCDSTSPLHPDGIAAWLVALTRVSDER
ncbi:class I SAM-dependent methyltransferase [Actinoallomurus sp. CA-142502]|uniref:class I SAM-dependent methyltransferase n=1 Tax=Actinoallomurus sp. CA-142502 TaxID=3239885 RepID=UPI003D917B05